MVTYFYRTIRDSQVGAVPDMKKGVYARAISHSEADVRKFAKKHKLDEDLVVDGIDLYESPRIARAGTDTYMYVRYCDTDGDLVSTYPLLIINTGENIITVSRKPSAPIERLLAKGEVITTQKVKTVLQILEEVNGGYRDYLNTVTKQMFATRRRLQKTIVKNDDILIFIDIEEDLNEFLTALQPYGILLHALKNGKYMSLHVDDKDLVEDLVLSTNELIDLTKSRLKTMQNIREAYNVIATNNLNKVFKRLTSISIFMMIPTVVSGLYGMNLILPGSSLSYGFWLIMAVIVVLVGLCIMYFNKRKWL